MNDRTNGDGEWRQSGIGANLTMTGVTDRLLLGVAVIAILVPTVQSLRRNPATLLRVE